MDRGVLLRGRLFRLALLILLGSDSTFWPDRYLTMLEDEVNRRRFVDWDERILVKRSYFMRDASLMGAACNAISPIFLGELLFEP